MPENLADRVKTGLGGNAGELSHQNCTTRSPVPDGEDNFYFAATRTWYKQKSAKSLKGGVYPDVDGISFEPGDRETSRFQAE